MHIVSLFPDVCKPYFEHSILGRAAEQGILEVYYYNPLDEISDLKRADDRPYGGGPGMVLKAYPFLQCFERIKLHSGTRKTIFFTPSGLLFTQKQAKEYAAYDNIILLCGHYEGIDERVADATGADGVSVGSFILTGGEIPALLVADAVARELPGVLGNRMSHENMRIAGGKVYTRPESFVYDGKTFSVPAVLCSGHHKNIDTYRENTKNSGT